MSDAWEVYVLGCGGHAKVVIRLLQQLGRRVNTIFDDDSTKWGAEFCGCSVTGPVSRIAEFPQRPAVIAIGNNQIRQAFDKQLDLEWLTAVHPHAFVDPTVQLGPGSVVFAGAVVQADAVLGRHVIINTGASVDHDCQLGDCVHVAPGARLAGEVKVGPSSLLGIGSAVVPCRRIGARTIVGAGATVVQDLPSDVTAVGVPACVCDIGK
jgi:sugar O-acyltransferase (sialic acid O-acetyltransferase NeuD family)